MTITMVDSHLSIQYRISLTSIECTTDTGNTVLVLQILKAYETLGDPVLRQKYDLSGMKEVIRLADLSPCI